MDLSPEPIEAQSFAGKQHFDLLPFTARPHISSVFAISRNFSGLVD
jgi:hypothetical protein